ncbi:MAG: hypothetical protein ABI777_09610 [Betaproteobacteria bacterium]
MMNTIHDSTNSPGSPADAWLDDLLTADGATQRAAYIDDAGFTARVVAELPRPAALPAWRRPMLVALWGAALIALVVAMPSLFVDLLREANLLLSAQPFSLVNMGMVLMALIALTWGAAAYSLREND